MRVPPSGTWEQRRAHTFGLAEDWVGPLEVDENEAIERLVRRYLAAFGPASRDDVAKFTGIPRARVKPVLGRMGLRRFRDEHGGRLYDLPRAPLPDPETPAPVRFLPTWDAVLLVHARRTGVLGEEHRAFVFDTKMPPSYPTFLELEPRLPREPSERVQLDPPVDVLPRAGYAAVDDAEPDRFGSVPQRGVVTEASRSAIATSDPSSRTRSLTKADAST